MTVSSDLDLAVLLADTEAEILRVVADHDPSTIGVYEMIRYHLGLDGVDGPRGKRMRPLLGLLAYASIAGEHTPGAARRGGRRAGPQLQPRPRRHRGRRRRAPPPARPCGRSTACPRRSTPAT